MSLQKYKKIKYLGKGSYGAAMLVCLKADSNRKFVIKEIVVGHLKPVERDAAKQEAEVLRQMTHSNITMYIESFVEGSKLYIVMEHADGGDLSGAIKRRAEASSRWPEHETMFIFVQICLALKHVHEHNILHRDLKSQNIFLTTKGIVKLGDFGIAKVLDASEDCARTQIGTPYYLSPEICESKPYGRSSDMWSLGIVLYELLALELPFQAQSLPALIIKICSVDPVYDKITPHYSPQMLKLVKSLLNKKSEERPDVRDLVRTELFVKHMSRLLSHTIRMGKGGAEGSLPQHPDGNDMPEDGMGDVDSDTDRSVAADFVDPEEVDRNIEVERNRQRDQDAENEKNRKEAQAQAERDAKRKEEIEKLKKLKQEMARKKENSEDIILVPSAAPLQGLARDPSQAPAPRAPPVVNPYPSVVSSRDRGGGDYSVQINNCDGVNEGARINRDVVGKDREIAYDRGRNDQVPNPSYDPGKMRPGEDIGRGRYNRDGDNNDGRSFGRYDDDDDSVVSRNRGDPNGPRLKPLSEIRNERVRQQLEAERRLVNENGQQDEYRYADQDRLGRNNQVRAQINSDENAQLRRHSEELRRQFLDNQSRAEEYRRKAGGVGQIISGGGAGGGAAAGLRNQITSEEKYESAARREYFANRAAAQQIKAKVEAYERGGAAGPSIVSPQISYNDREVSPRERLNQEEMDRVSLMKAQREKEREREVAEHEKRIHQALLEQRDERKRNEERRKMNADAQTPAIIEVDSGLNRASVQYEDPDAIRRRREKEKMLQREAEDKRRMDALEIARVEAKEQRKQLREAGRDMPAGVAFEVGFNDVNSNKKDSKLDGPSPKLGKVGSSSPSAAAPRQRRGWGTPSALNELKVLPAENVVQVRKPYRLSDDIDAENISEEKEDMSFIRSSKADEIQEGDTLRSVQIPKPRPLADSSVAAEVSDEILGETKEIEEDEQAVMRVLEAREDREAEARNNAREVFRKLKEQRKKDASSRRSAASVPTSLQAVKNNVIETNKVPQVSSANVSPVKNKEEPSNSPFRIYKKGSDNRISESSSSEMKEKLMNSDNLYELSSDDEIDEELESNLDRYLLRQQMPSDQLVSETKYSGYINNVKIKTATARSAGGSKAPQIGHESAAEDGEVADLQCILANALLHEDPDSKNPSY